MDNMKIAGAALVALLVAVGLGQLGNAVFSTHGDDHAVRGYTVAAPDDGGGEVAAVEEEAVLEPVLPLLAAADAGAGERLFRRCTACHSVDKGGANKIGPGLWGILGREPGTHDGFAYSDTLRALAATWDYEALNGFIASPKDYAPGTKMNFTGLADVSDRANLIAFLRDQSDAPLPLPGQ